MPSERTTTVSDAATLPTSSTTNSIDSTDPDRVIFRGNGTSTVNSTHAESEHHQNNDTDCIMQDDEEPIAPIRPPIHSKTKNWYSAFCNRWASLVGVSCLSFFLRQYCFWLYLEV